MTMTTRTRSRTTAALAAEAGAVDDLHLSTAQQALSSRRQPLASVSQFRSFMARNPPASSTPRRNEATVQAHRENSTSSHHKATPASREHYQWFEPGDDGPGDDPDDPGDNNDEDNDEDFMDTPDDLDPNLAVLNNLAIAVNRLSHSAKRTNNSSSSCAKVRELDTFDGMDPKKLRTFLVQYKLCFQDHPKAFHQDRAKVTFAQSYLKGMTLEWFELDLLDPSSPAQCPHWIDSWIDFVTELQKTFSPHDPIADVEHQLEHLVMKDNHRVTRYIMDFNCLASQVQDYRDGTLCCLFYSGLPDCLKDEIARVGKPWTLDGLCALCQEIDAHYWERKDKVSCSAKSQPSSSKPSNSGGNSSSKSGQEKSKTSNSSSSGNSSGSSKTNKQPSSSSPKPDLTSKLGKDSKLMANDCKRRLDNNLCMFCGGTGHFADQCPKKSKKAKACAAATEKSAESSKVDSNSGASPESKK